MTRGVTLSVIALILLVSVASPAFNGQSKAEASLSEQHGPQASSLPQAVVGDGSLGDDEFFREAPQGLGDRQNSAIWSMKWWDKTGKLFVGTNRAWLCWSSAAWMLSLPDFMSGLYPPRDPEVECTADYRDLPLRAEIWSWTPDPDFPDAPGTWDLLYRSPEDVPMYGTTKLVARDIGYRSMTVFTEPDGTEALYVGTVTSRALQADEFKGQVPPPRILRSTDGVTFEPIPQDPGTTMGDLPKASFRSLMSFQGKLYVVHSGIQGTGKVYESADPAAGNDAWRQVTPDELQVFVVKEFNGFLYLGILGDPGKGYSVLKTDATGEPPYTFTSVVPAGGNLTTGKPSRGVVSMQVFNNALYVGTDNPAELIRINSDDSWDLIVGTAREAPDGGWKVPLSGMDEGFGDTTNDHIWRMQSYNGTLYLGTHDSSTVHRLCVQTEKILHDYMGFDLYKTTDGVHLSAITLNGFGDVFDSGVRTLESTPYGLFVGTVNHYHGTNVYRGINFGPSYLEPPGDFQARGIVQFWKPSPGATRYRVFRSTYVKVPLNPLNGFVGDGCAHDYKPPTDSSAPIDQIPVESTKFQLEPLRLKRDEVPGLAVEIGTTSNRFFFDTNREPDVKYAYYVVAEDDFGSSSERSNLSSSPRWLLSVTLSK